MDKENTFFFMDDTQTVTTEYVALNVSVISIPYSWNLSPVYFNPSLFTEQEAFSSPLSSFWANEEQKTTIKIEPCLFVFAHLHIQFSSEIWEIATRKIYHCCNKW